MKQLVIYVHGKGGSAEEANHYQHLFADSDVIGLDYKAQTPWEAKTELSDFFDLYSKDYDEVVLIANSIGAYFSMCGLYNKRISRAFFISPIVNMEKLITDMMMWANVTEDELKNKGEISTQSGENLSFEYLYYARKNPINWSVPTNILYGSKDNVTSAETLTEFVNKIGASITVMEGGEHWFHIDEQMSFLDNWISNLL